MFVKYQQCLQNGNNTLEVVKLTKVRAKIIELDFRFCHNLPNFYPIVVILLYSREYKEHFIFRYNILVNCEKLQGKNEEENFQLCEYWLTIDKNHI